MNEKVKKILTIFVLGVIIMVVAILSLSYFQNKSKITAKNNGIVEQNLEIDVDNLKVTVNEKINTSYNLLLTENELNIKTKDNETISIENKKSKQYFNDVESVFIVSERKSIKLSDNLLEEPVVKDVMTDELGIQKNENTQPEIAKEETKINEIKKEVIIDDYSISGKVNSYSFENVAYEDIKGVSISDNHIYIVEENKGENKEKLLISKYEEKGENKLIESKTINKVEIENFMVVNENIIYSVENKIYQLNFETFEKEELNLGETIKDMYKINEAIFIFNDFGKGKNNSLLFKIDIDTFKVVQVYQTKDKDYVIKGLDLVNNKIILENKQLKFSDNLIEGGLKILEFNIEDSSIVLNDTKNEFETYKNKYDKVLDSKFFIIR